MIRIVKLEEEEPKVITEEETKFPICVNLVFLPPYSHDLNPIEFIWKSIKREMSPLLIKTVGKLKSIIVDCFYRFKAY